LHGRPGEDGTLQGLLEHYDIPYNGSGVQATALTIDKYATNQYLAQQGFHVAQQLVITKENWNKEPLLWVNDVENRFTYPMIAKPVDDGCSAGVVKITNRAILLAYASASFSPFDSRQELGLEEENNLLPQERFLLEDFIEKDQKVSYCLETTTGLLTHIGPNNETLYEIFEPSEVLAADAILSLEEKFLAGEGHNITPARFHEESQTSIAISKMVRIELAKVAEALNLQGYARIDAFVKINCNQKVEVWIVEINALPAMTPATCIFHQCALNSYTPFAFIEAIIEYGFTKRNFTL
jgi:D-alanine-D-alanine ligase